MIVCDSCVKSEVPQDGDLCQACQHPKTCAECGRKIDDNGDVCSACAPDVIPPGSPVAAICMEQYREGVHVALSKAAALGVFEDVRKVWQGEGTQGVFERWVLGGGLWELRPFVFLGEGEESTAVSSFDGKLHLGKRCLSWGSNPESSG